MTRLHRFWLALVVLPGLQTVAAAAAAISFTGVSGGYIDNNNRVVGWEFTTGSRSISVDRLGAYDHGQNGLARPHVVGIFANANQSLVTMAIVPAGTAAPLTESFRYAPIVPAVLAPNTGYVVATTWPASGDSMVWSPSIGNPIADIMGLSIDSAIMLGLTSTGARTSARYDDAATSLEFPNKRVSNEFPGDTRAVFVGPNFSFSVLPLRRDLGDYNDNGIVDAADYLVWRKAFTSFSPNADGDSDGDVDQADYEVWRAHFGQTATGSGAVALAPEPSTALLVALAMAALAPLRRSR